MGKNAPAFSGLVSSPGRVWQLTEWPAQVSGSRVQWQWTEHTAAGQMLVMVISFFPSLTQSIAKPFVRTDMATFPIAYAVFPLKKRE